MSEILPGVTTENLDAPVQRPFNHKPTCSRAYFLGAPGGTGKTFTIRAIQSLLKIREHRVIAVATSAVAASLLDGGRSAHSEFKIPIPCYLESVCNISMESKLANDIRRASLIIWDEIVMCLRYCIEAVDRTLRAIMKAPYVPFGGKCILFSGDFRQILPVVPRGSRGMIVFMSFKSSPLYQCVDLLSLNENMRLEANVKYHETNTAVLGYPAFLLKVGEGKFEVTTESLIELPTAVNVVGSSTDLVKSVFQNLNDNHNDVHWLTSRAILTLTNNWLKSLNEKVAEWFPGNFSHYQSADSVMCDSLQAKNAAELRYPQELLNSIEVGGSLPDHSISLKKGFIVMLLRNIKPSAGHVNGARYVVENMTPTLLYLRSTSGSRTGVRLILPRMNCTVSKDDFPILGFRTCQFPIRVCFAMTVKKAEVQSIRGTLGIDLLGQCFSHGQLYVALSRTTNPRNVFICTADGSRRTKNVVFTEVFDTYDDCTRNLLSVTPRDPVNQLATQNRMSISYLLNPETPSSIPCLKESEDDVISISDDDSAVLMQCKKNELPFNNHSTLEFESIHGVIPNMITCAGITFTKAEFATVITPRSWVTDIVISSFMKLLNQDTVLALETAFVTILCSSIGNNSIATHGEFLEYFYGHGVRNIINR